MSGITDPDHALPAIDGATFSTLADEFGTPAYIYGGDSIRLGAQELLDSLDQQVEVYYSLKANPAIAICSLIRQAGVHGAEIASSGELITALQSGYQPASILFAGPGKTDDELRHAISTGVGQINAESINEIRRIHDIANQLGLVQRVGVRINPAGATTGSAKIKTSGSGQKFGIEESQAASAINEIFSSTNIEFAGIHTMLGSQVLDADELLNSCRSTRSMVIRIAQTLGIEIPTVNFGGGLGAAHKEDDQRFNIKEFGQALSKIVEDSRSHKALRHCRFMIEPGRVLVSKHGFYLARVIDTKESITSRVAILDGGINHALLPITANKYRIRIANRKPAAVGSPVMIGGPLCTSADQWRSQVLLDDVRIGDLILMYNAGAYGLTASMTKFLSRETPAEVLVLKGQAHLIRERSRPSDVLRGQSRPGSLEND